MLGLFQFGDIKQYFLCTQPYKYVLGLLIQVFLFLPSALLFLDVIDRELGCQRQIERERERGGEEERAKKRERERGGEWGEERKTKRKIECERERQSERDKVRETE